MKSCQQCGSPFEPRNERKGHPARFCSRKCSGLAQRKRVTLVCRQCGRPFERKAYMADWSQDRGPFCGFRCYGEWQRENSTGDGNPNFRPSSPRRGAGEWERNRLRALERDGHRCVRCGSARRLHVHHRKPWNDRQKHPHALDNLETLCASCHRRSHPMEHGPDGKFLTIQ